MKNVLKLAGGTAGSQVITLAVAPILTRLYGPASFGVLASFTSILALVNVVSSLRYELAIVVPEDDDEAIALVWLCFALLIISTSLVALVVLCIGNNLSLLLGQKSLGSVLWLLPIGVLLSGVYQTLSYWAIRFQKFDLLAKTRLRQSIFGVTVNLAFAPLGSIGLLTGQILGQSIGFASIFWYSKKVLLQPGLSLRSLKKVLFRYKHFGIYESIAGLINATGSLAPNLIIFSFFGPASLGQLSLAQRFFLLPAGLISSSVGQVLMNKVAAEYRAMKLQELVRRASLKLLIYGLASAFLICIAFPPLVPFFFGKKWALVQYILPLLAPMFVGEFVVTPVSNVFIGSQKLRLAVVFQVFLAICKIVPIALFGHSRGFIESLGIYSISCAAGYLFYLVGIDAIVARSSSCDQLIKG